MKIGSISNVNFKGDLVVWADSDLVVPNTTSERELKSFAKETGAYIKRNANGNLFVQTENGMHFNTENIDELSMGSIGYFVPKLDKKITIGFLNMNQEQYNNLLDAYNAACNGATVNIEI